MHHSRRTAYKKLLSIILVFVWEFLSVQMVFLYLCNTSLGFFCSRDRVREHPDPEKAKRDFVARQKMGRLGTAEEIAALVTYLAADEVSA